MAYDVKWYGWEEKVSCLEKMDIYSLMDILSVQCPMIDENSSNGWEKRSG